MMRFLKRLMMLIMACVLAVCLTVAFIIYDFSAPGPLPQEKTVIFMRGSGFQAIVDKLAAEGVITHPLLFKAVAVLLGDARKFKAGEYDFSPAITPQLVMYMISEGKVVVHKVTVPEGLTVLEIKQLLQNEPILEGDFPADVEEGSLLPETYHYIYGDKRQDVVARMQTAMNQLLHDLWSRRKDGLPLANPHEALTLASIVEKETGVDAERAKVASVFINRLRKGMKLQTDPTVIYAIAKDGGPFKHSLTLDDLAHPSPYNTYVNMGLPPGPICNPGRAALEATLNPEDTDFLYFVATGSGGHHFAATLDEHNRNVASYRKALSGK